MWGPIKKSRVADSPLMRPARSWRAALGHARRRGWLQVVEVEEGEAWELTPTGIEAADRLRRETHAPHGSVEVDPDWMAEAARGGGYNWTFPTGRHRFVRDLADLGRRIGKGDRPPKWALALPPDEVEEGGSIWRTPTIDGVDVSEWTADALRELARAKRRERRGP